jgi:4'-phosphopantetheinyl transferase
MPMEQLTLYCLTQKLADLPTDESWLAAGERVRAAGFRFAKRRNDWILGRWTAKRALRAYLAQTGHGIPDYPAIEIRSAPDGAPEPFWNGALAPVSLTLSHSESQGFCAITRPGIPVGCDLETVSSRDWTFIFDYFCAEERSFLTNARADRQPLLSTLVWSAKESALKCLRAGLRRDTRSVLVHVAGEGKSSWNMFTAHCLESKRAFYGWWRESGGCVQTVAAGMPAREPVELAA